MSIRTRMQVSHGTQVGIVRVLQVLLIAILGFGLYTGNVVIAFDAAIGLFITQLPALLERRYQIVMDVWLVIWITTAVFLHAFGTVPLPGLDFESLYGATWWWDHLTHALSSSIVVASGYAATRALQEHTEHIQLGPKFMFAYLLIFVLAFGVLWELLEFYIAVGADLFGIPQVLTQYGLDDTVLDLMYNSIGGMLVAVFGTRHLVGISDQLGDRLESRSANR
ncbi:hypothetical protein [Halorubrum sp. N11]|uniref:hypothetical protein n=1 Tax=Halorubrum sp. N11 TaxID=3402276 RepID=UPI003EB9A2C8